MNLTKLLGSLELLYVLGGFHLNGLSKIFACVSYNFHLTFWFGSHGVCKFLMGFIMVVFFNSLSFIVNEFVLSLLGFCAVFDVAWRFH